jgi:predicted  nucleic acid-binding Zn-ribbon protein
MEKKEIVLTEEQINRLKLDNSRREINIIKIESQLERAETWLSTGYHKRVFEAGVEDLRKAVKSGKNLEGKEIDDLELEELKVQLIIREKELKEDLPGKELRLNIADTREKLEKEISDLKKVEKQIREKKIIWTQ